MISPGHFLPVIPPTTSILDESLIKIGQEKNTTELRGLLKKSVFSMTPLNPIDVNASP